VEPDRPAKALVALWAQHRCSAHEAAAVVADSAHWRAVPRTLDLHPGPERHLSTRRKRPRMSMLSVPSRISMPLVKIRTKLHLPLLLRKSPRRSLQLRRRLRTATRRETVTREIPPSDLFHRSSITSSPDSHHRKAPASDFNGHFPRLPSALYSIDFLISMGTAALGICVALLHPSARNFTFPLRLPVLPVCTKSPS
jgi:hypothetical protein